MNSSILIRSCASVLGALLLSPLASAQTAGTVTISATLKDQGAGPEHWCVMWVTNATTGAYVATIRKQAYEARSPHWDEHCPNWYAAAGLASSATNFATVPDGFTGATAISYASPNSPFTQAWTCKNASGTTIPDGNYKIWIQYAENIDGEPGPASTGLLWTKGATASTVTPANQGTNFTNLSIAWKPGTTATKPEIAVQQPVGTNLVDGTAKKSFGTLKVGKAGTAKTFTIKNLGTANLTGLAITKNGTAAANYTVTAPLVKTLAPGKSTTFKVTFKPSAKGTRTAAIHIKSNDANENPFDISLTGLGN